MRIKRFVAPTMRQAMKLVREEMGDDAVILSSRQMDDRVEVTAAVDPDTVTSAVRFAPTSKVETSSWEALASHQEARSTASAYTAGAMRGSEDMTMLYQELKQMRTMLEQQLSGFAWQQAQQQDPVKVELLKRLIGMGVGWELAHSLLGDLNGSDDVEQDWRAVQASLLARIPVMHDSLLETGGVVALVGPTGVGKTTTIAKLAARYVLRYGTADCAVVTLDTYKIGAQEQLKIFTDLIGVPLMTARTPGEFFRLLERLSARKLVLVDTAGLSQRDARLQEYLADSLDDDSGTVRSLLVVSAATQIGVLREIMTAFGRLKPVGCILTKLDEASLLGPALTLLAENSLPIAYCTNGQRVPEDLMPAVLRDLLDQAIAMGRARSAVTLDAAHYGFGREMSDV